MDSASSASRHPSAESSLYTTTSSSTQWGPGALAGKAILAMGKAVVRSAEHLIILRRMAVIKAATPCSDDHSTQFGDLETMFDDLLELSRPMLYPEAIRIQAMQIILAQIARKETLHLRGSISRWEIEHDELVVFLSGIVGVILFSKRGFPDKKLVNAYMAALSKDFHPWAPCITFLSGVAQLNGQTFHAVLSARFLETILWGSGVQMQGRNYDNPLETDCNSAFKVLIEPPTADLSILWVEQVRRFSCRDPHISLRGLVESITCQRMWLMVERRLLDLHVYPILGALLPTRYPSGRPFLDYSFSRSPPKTILSTASAMRNFLRYVAIGGDVGVLAQMIRHLISQSAVHPPDIANTTVQFLVDISRFLHWEVLNAAVLNMVPFLYPPWDSSRIHQEVHQRMYFRSGRNSRPPYVIAEVTIILLRTIVSSLESRFPRSHLLPEPAAKAQVRDLLHSNSQPPEHLPSTIPYPTSSRAMRSKSPESEPSSPEWKSKMI
ncbi:hypothetical protein C8R44DRAFT_984025 [Mycena epipterygia]|nr:hypothetical protein C8R44DRAFT_984025 [Mycena epipterygia]